MLDHPPFNMFLLFYSLPHFLATLIYAGRLKVQWYLSNNKCANFYLSNILDFWSKHPKMWLFRLLPNIQVRDVVKMDVEFCAVIHADDFHHVVFDDARDDGAMPTASAISVERCHAQPWKRIKSTLKFPPDQPFYVKIVVDHQWTEFRCGLLESLRNHRIILL